MILYHIPTFSSNCFIFFFVSSSLFILVGLYFLVFQKAPTPVIYTTLLVGIFSMIHHLRNYDEEYDDIVRIVDIFFANLLALCVLYYRPTMVTLLFGVILLCTFLSIQYWIKYWYKSMVHALFHTSICIFLLFSFQHEKDLKILKQSK